MKFIKVLLLSSAMSLGFGAFTSANAECGKVEIANMSWTSAAVLAEFDALVLREGFGCDTEVVAGDTMPTSTSMVEKLQPDIASEMWTNGLGAFWEDGIAEGRVTTGGLSMSGGGEGFFIPTAMLEANPELATIEGVLANPQLFPHPEGKDVGAFYGCPAGWNCQITSTNVFNAFGFGEAGFEIIDPGSGAALGAAAAGAHDKGQGWVGYYWGPTALLGLRDFTKVSVGADEGWSADKWACVTEEPNMDKTGADACARTYYANATIEVAYTSDFAARAPKKVMDYLNNRMFSDKEIGMLLDIVAQEAYSPEDAAIYMVLEKQDLWSKMVCGGTFTDCPEKQAIIAAVQ